MRASKVRLASSGRRELSSRQGAGSPVAAAKDRGVGVVVGTTDHCGRSAQCKLA